MIGLVAPRVNINGTSREELRDQYRSVIAACDALLVALLQSAPRRQDYQTYDNPCGAFVDATNQYLRRAEAVARIREELEKLLEVVEYRPLDVPAPELTYTTDESQEPPDIDFRPAGGFKEVSVVLSMSDEEWEAHIRKVRTQGNQPRPS